MNPTQGSAISETLVGLLALLPAFWAMDYLGRLHDMQRSAVHAARYAIWDQTAARNPRDGLSLEIRDRIHGNEHASLKAIRRLRTAGVSQNPLWDNARGPLINKDAPARVQAQQASGDMGLPAVGIGVGGLAHGDRLPSALRIAGLGARMLDFERERLAIYQADVSARPLQGSRAGDQPVTLTARGALTTGDWQAFNDASYQRRTEDIVASETFSMISKPATMVGYFPLFQEARYAQSTDFVPPSRLQPR